MAATTEPAFSAAASSPSAKSAAPAPVAYMTTHNPSRRVTDLMQRLAPGKMRIGFLIGAGCPLAIRVPTDNGTIPLIPDLAGLSNGIRDFLLQKADLSELAKTVWLRVSGGGLGTSTIEDVLGHIRILNSLSAFGGIPGFPENLLSSLDTTICTQIREIASKNLPNSDSPYHSLASWIQAIPREHPVEVFTTNYDLLFEQALEERRVPYFDGFVGSDSAFLDLESMAKDDLPARWARVWKIHGSINWWLTANNKIRRSRDVKEGEQLLVYPSHLKYDQSRQMPYYAMLDRLRVFLRSGQCVLIICGYSFGDDHINSYIREGLSGNPSASCMGMIYGDAATAPKAMALAKRHANLTLMAADCGVVGTVSGAWTDEARDTNSAYAIAVGKDVTATRTTAPLQQPKWLLGDFAALGAFLAHQLSSRSIDSGAADGY